MKAFQRLATFLNINERTLLALAYLAMGAILGVGLQRGGAACGWCLAIVLVLLAGGWAFNHTAELFRYLLALEEERSQVLRERPRY